ncbi:hypothetical protein P20495_1587 [Pseudoalteromonas sp. BSi20495]|nr:hypothetical protein P20495_1587 [Pseudoalteromonas sp. BSi20495]
MGEHACAHFLLHIATSEQFFSNFSLNTLAVSKHRHQLANLL